MLQIHVVFSAKAYWDGPTKSCIPREKGGCCHIWVEGMEPGPGEMAGEMTMVRDKTCQFTVSRSKGMNTEHRMNCFSDGKFNLDGPLTFDPDLLKKLGFDENFTVPAGTYPVTFSGDILTITFK